jgi:hypothetical protein
MTRDCIVLSRRVAVQVLKRMPSRIMECGVEHEYVAGDSYGAYGSVP